ncbi:FABR228Cp [Eremothecium gossypii FDAG1]|nr:FABR228Cp [Eremothecium gossypii FDAG1]
MAQRVFFHMVALVLCQLLNLGLVAAKVHRFNFTTGWVTARPDGVAKQVIGFNGQWPLPDIHVDKGDRVELYLTNGFADVGTTLHFHGLFHNSSEGNLAAMDGPDMVTQCGIPPGQTYLYNFSVPTQVGTYWYHSHTGAQYADGMRGAFVVHDPDAPFEYDEEMTLMVGDIYHKPYTQLVHEFLSRYNPTGAEPVPQNLLFNNTVDGSLYFKPNKTYLLRIINGAFFVSQYLYLEGHEFTIVETDGVYVQPNATNLLYLASGQRVSVLVHTKETTDRNFAFMQLFDEDMLDDIPSSLQLNRTNHVIYDDSKPRANPYFLPDYNNPAEEFYLTPLHGKPLYEHYDRQVVLDLHMDNLADGVNYAFFNNITYTTPKVPTLTTALTAGEFASNPLIYGNVNPFVLRYGEIVEIVINNYDDGKHPFHLHGHNFQLVQKSPASISEDGETVRYNESAPVMPYPEFPATRDTVVLEPNGHIVLRFRADNPGVWIFHCHVNWHMEQGLAAVFIEAPHELQAGDPLSDNYRQVCAASNIPNAGNAGGNSANWLDLSDAPRQQDPLPAGFTAKGYFAFALTTLAGLLGLYTITNFGLQKSVIDDAEMHNKLSVLLKENNVLD